MLGGNNFHFAELDGNQLGFRSDLRGSTHSVVVKMISDSVRQASIKRSKSAAQLKM